jgi:DNA-directed RNA polymerase I, II, and III subunit RPABC1
MNLDENEILTIFRVRKTILQMLRDRGYVVFDSKDDLELSRQMFEEKFVKINQVIIETLEIKRPKWNLPSQRILVVFVKSEKEKSTIGVKKIREYCERIKQDDFHKAILILHGRLTPHAKQAISAINSLIERIEYFNESELIINITEHCLVPRHEVLLKEDCKKLLEKYSIKESQLPKINKNDPVARYLGIEKNQIVKIIRISETSGRYVTYRRCCS